MKTEMMATELVGKKLNLIGQDVLATLRQSYIITVAVLLHNIYIYIYICIYIYKTIKK